MNSEHKMFGDLLNEYIADAERDIPWLAEKSGVEAKNFYRWSVHDGKPRNAWMVIRIADVFQLDEEACDQLLIAAGHIPLRRVKVKIKSSDKITLAAIARIETNLSLNMVRRSVLAGADVSRLVNDSGQNSTHSPEIDLRTSFQHILEQHHNLFAGRDLAINRIKDFMAGPSGYFFIEGPAGFGKTALMAHLVREFRHLSVFYHFFSRNLDYVGESDFQTSLARYLLTQHSMKMDLPQTSSDLRALCIKLLQTPAPSNSPILILIDALDEADFSRQPYFVNLGTGVHIIFTVRQTAEQDWLHDLHLHGRAERIVLEAMDQDEILALVQSAGLECEDMNSLVNNLEKVTEGLPFFLRMLVEDLQRDWTGTRDKIGELLRIPFNTARQASLQLHPRLTSYLDSLYQDLLRLAEGEAVEQLLGYLTASLGPIPRADLVAIDPKDALRTLPADKAIMAVRRLIIGDRQRGYTFCHEILREYLTARYGDEIQPYRERLLSYCSGWMEHHSAYALRYYVRYLAAENRWEEIHRLVATGDQYQVWVEARLSTEGNYTGYLEDINLAWQHADEIDHINRQVRYALIAASVSTVYGNVPPKLLRQLLAHKVSTEDFVLECIRQRKDEDSQAKALIEVATLLMPLQGRIAVDLASTFGVSFNRSMALAALVPHMDPGQKDEILPRIIESLTEMTDESEKVKILIRLIPYLASDKLTEILEIAAETLSGAYERIRILTSMIPIVPPDQGADLLNQVKWIAEGIESRALHAESLALIIPYLPMEERENAIERVVALADMIEEAHTRSWVLRSLAEVLPFERQKEILQYAYSREWQRELGYVIYQTVWKHINIAESLPTEQGEQLLRSFLEWTSSFDDYQFAIFDTLLPYLPPKLIEQALEAVENIHSAVDRMEALDSLAPFLPKELLARALDATKFVGDGLEHVQAISGLIPYLSAELQIQAMQHALLALSN